MVDDHEDAAQENSDSDEGMTPDDQEAVPTGFTVDDDKEEQTLDTSSGEFESPDEEVLEGEPPLEEAQADGDDIGEPADEFEQEADEFEQEAGEFDETEAESEEPADEFDESGDEFDDEVAAAEPAEDIGEAPDTQQESADKFEDEAAFAEPADQFDEPVDEDVEGTEPGFEEPQEEDFGTDPGFGETADHPSSEAEDLDEQPEAADEDIDFGVDEDVDEERLSSETSPDGYESTETSPAGYDEAELPEEAIGEEGLEQEEGEDEEQEQLPVVLEAQLEHLLNPPEPEPVDTEPLPSVGAYRDPATLTLYVDGQQRETFAIAQDELTIGQGSEPEATAEGEDTAEEETWQPDIDIGAHEGGSNIWQRHLSLYRQNKNYTLYVTSDGATQVNEELLALGDYRRLEDGDVIVVGRRIGLEFHLPDARDVAGYGADDEEAFSETEQDGDLPEDELDIDEPAAQFDEPDAQFDDEFDEPDAQFDDEFDEPEEGFDDEFDEPEDEFDDEFDEPEDEFDDEF